VELDRRDSGSLMCFQFALGHGCIVCRYTVSTDDINSQRRHSAIISRVSRDLALPAARTTWSAPTSRDRAAVSRKRGGVLCRWIVECFNPANGS
jgi:hypothetical protein